MRFLLFLFSPAVVLFAQALTAVDTAAAAPQKPKARLEGHVVSATTGEPLRKANLHLRMVQSIGMGPAPSVTTQYVVGSDAEGKFAFEDLDPGRYTLTADRVGFVRQSYGARSPDSAGTNLSLDSGQEIKDIVFKLVPQGTISGRAVDEDGDPADSAFVQVYRYVYVRGHRQLQQMNGATVQPDGTFVVAHLAAGRYYVAAIDQRTSNGMEWEKYGGKGVEEGYARTYFPSALDFTSAAPVDVGSGADVRGIEIRMRKSQMFRIRGKVTGYQTKDYIYLLLTQKVDGQIMWGDIRNSSVNPRDGNFEFNHVTPGTYEITSNNFASAGGAPPPIAYLELTVGDHNMDGLTIGMIPAPQLGGTVRVEGWDSLQPPQSAQQGTVSTPSAAAQPVVRLEAMSGESRFGYPSSRVDDDGTFRINSVRPNRYRAVMTNLPEGTYLKSIHLGGEDVMRSGIDVTAGSNGTLEVVLSPNAADISGVIHKENGDLATGVRVTIWSPGDPDSLKTANTDQNGSFKIRNLGPAEYRIAAWEDVELGLLQDPDFQARFDGKATTLKLAENAHETPDVKLIAKEESDAEAEKVK